MKLLVWIVVTAAFCRYGVWTPFFGRSPLTMQLQRFRMQRRDDSLIGQVVAANVVLVALTLLGASLAAGLDLTIADQRWQFLILALAIVLSLCVNLWMLQRRFRPLEGLIERIERIDPAQPTTLELEGDPVEEIDRLATSFKRLLQGIEAERRRSGQAVLRAQEDERRRLARDLHDEVNQALTAMLLRLEALAQDAPPERADEVAELKRLAGEAMEELLSLARQLRPTALDDHGLAAAIQAQLTRFAAQTGMETEMRVEGDPATLDEDAQTALYRIAQEALANAGRHAGAAHVEVVLSIGDEGAALRVSDDGAGFDPTTPGGGGGGGAGLGLQGMAERARLAGGELDVRSSPGSGTTVMLRLP
jgi:two-component system sensor histidine kinase UhpB